MIVVNRLELGYWSWSGGNPGPSFHVRHHLLAMRTCDFKETDIEYGV